jgi:hypothetical protein
MRGAGDLVAAIAQPVARVVDRVAHTNLAGCGGCKRRQEILNHAIPFNQQPPMDTNIMPGMQKQDETVLPDLSREGQGSSSDSETNQERQK